MTIVPTYGGIPALGYGTFRMKGDDCIACVGHALQVGYRHIDTATFYENEREVGRAISQSGIARGDIFLTTKVWHDSFGAGQVRASAEASLERLGMDYVDLLLIHWPPTDGPSVAEVVTAAAEVKAAGLARRIGVSNFTRAQIDEAIAAVGAGEIATNQCEMNVAFQNRPIAEHCNAAGIPMTAYQPLVLGDAAGFSDVTRIAKRHGATGAQVALAWLLARGHIAIPSSSNAGRIEENLQAANVALTAGDLTDLDRLDTGKRRVNPSWAPVWDAA
ncbi:MAG: aldo/keto reductase [Pseudomonadota bacterium]